MVSEISHNALSGKGVGSLHTKFPENYVYKDFFFFFNEAFKSIPVIEHCSLGNIHLSMFLLPVGRYCIWFSLKYFCSKENLS